MGYKPLKKLSHYFDNEDVWEAIENNINIDTLYPDNFNINDLTEQYLQYMDKIVVNGEQYVLLYEEHFDYALTSFGRVINCSLKKEIGVDIAYNDCILHMRENKIKMSKLFKQNNWDFNFDEILRIHKENKWKIQIKRWDKMGQRVIVPHI
jgi:hypothetical protein